MNFAPFTKKSPVCPKCGGKTIRRYCTAETWICLAYFKLNRQEHLDITCQECGFQRLQAVKSSSPNLSAPPHSKEEK